MSWVRILVIISFISVLNAQGNDGISSWLTPEIIQLEQTCLRPLYPLEELDQLKNKLVRESAANPGQIYFFNPDSGRLPTYFSKLKNDLSKQVKKLELFETDKVTVGMVVQLHQIYLGLNEVKIYPQYKKMIFQKNHIKERILWRPDGTSLTNEEIRKRTEEAAVQIEKLEKNVTDKIQNIQAEIKKYTFKINLCSWDSLEVDKSTKVIEICFDEDDFDDDLKEQSYEYERRGETRLKIEQNLRLIKFDQWLSVGFFNSDPFIASTQYQLVNSQLSYMVNYETKLLTPTDFWFGRGGERDIDLITAAMIISKFL